MVIILDEDVLYALWENRPIWIKRRRYESTEKLEWEKSTTTIPESTKTSISDTNDTYFLEMALDQTDLQILKALMNNIATSKEIAEITGISEITVRRRYKKLKEMGLILVRRKKGAHLTPTGEKYVSNFVRFRNKRFC